MPRKKAKAVEAKAPEPTAYDRRKEAARARNAEIAEQGRDIGEIPAVEDPARRAGCERSLEQFCLTYLPSTFALPFSADHRRVIGKAEAAVLAGGLFALAMPRGSGKTSLCEAACLWALVYGHRLFVVLIGADAAAAQGMLESIKTELESNDVLAGDFPAVCHPIRKLEGIANRCAGQLCEGERTHITWTQTEVILPAIAGSPAAGAILRGAGITGRVRGMKHKTADGRSIRPDLVVIDDPQTDESANSATQCATRERTLAGAILGLAGPGKKIAGLMPCTVIRGGDVADRILDAKVSPQWKGERCKLVYGLPVAEDLWTRYAELRAESFRAGRAGEEATAFYAANRAAMDAGCAPAWPERFLPDELSGVQHAMNLKLQNEAAFWSEYMNEPQAETGPAEAELTGDQVAARATGLARRIAPTWATRLTAFVDVQQAVLFYAVVGWGDDFTGSIIDYGAFPKQSRAYFTARDARPTLAELVAGGGLEAQLTAGLTLLTAELLGTEWQREGGAGLKIERCLIDANWGQSTDVVYEFCRRSPHAAIVMPSHGKFVGASGQAMGDRAKKPGERAGLNWFSPLKGRRPNRYVIFDANFWKSFVASRLAVPAGGVGRLDLFGRPTDHKLFAEHLTSEYRVRVTGRGRSVDEWKPRPSRPENHWLDCVVGCAVAAEMQGARLSDLGGEAPKAGKRKVSFADMQRRARQKEAS
jgi:hypothetical protein